MVPFLGICGKLKISNCDENVCSISTFLIKDQEDDVSGGEHSAVMHHSREASFLFKRCYIFPSSFKSYDDNVIILMDYYECIPVMW